MLLLCTANQCRSPMAAGILHQLVSGHVPVVAVSSAGLATGGHSADEVAVDTMRARGIDISDHVSRKADRSMLESADLVIAMERWQVREVSVLAPSVWPRTFPLVDLVRRIERTGARGPDMSFRAWVDLLHVGRQASDLLRGSAEDDIPDPKNGPAAGFARTADVLQSLLQNVADGAFRLQR